MVNAEHPIFVVGAPRSGTSLLRVTLNRHPSIWLCDETGYSYWVYFRRRAFGDLGVPSFRRRLISSYLETKAAKRVGLRQDALADVLMRKGTSYEAFFTALIRFSASEQGKTRFGDKTPGHAFFTETLCEWYPQCMLIHIVRDPRDVVASLQRVPFGNNCVLANARTWLTHVSRAERSRHRENYLLVKYEQLIANSEAELRRILAFVGEEYTPRMLTAEEPTKDTDWWSRRAQKPLQRDRVGKWREQLDEKQMSLVEWLTGRKMEELGYEPEGQKVSTPALGRALIHESFDYLLVRMARLPTLWYYWIRPTNLAAEDKAWAHRKA